VTVKHVHVRKPVEFTLPSFVPAWIQSYAQPAADSKKLKISFATEEPVRYGKSGRRARK
jgi:hypothetical protein